MLLWSLQYRKVSEMDLRMARTVGNIAKHDNYLGFSSEVRDIIPIKSPKKIPITT